MKNTGTLVGFLGFMLMAAAGVYVANHRYHFIVWPTAAATPSAAKALYYCPMHPEIQSDKPGECPICHMSLEKRADQNPEQASNAPQNSIFISPQKQQLIGVKTQEAQVMPLRGEIVTVGKVAYDPDLFIAQQEYLQALKYRPLRNNSGVAEAPEPPQTFLETARRKLMLLGMSQDEIEQLALSGKAQQNLYLPDPNDTAVWVYIAVYEYEAGRVKEGLSVEVKSPAYPGETFDGQIIAIAPLLDPLTRSLRVRAMVNNPEQKLRLEMFVEVTIQYDLGEKLAIPEEAVMHAGTRDIVYVTDTHGYFEPRLVTLGAAVGGYDEVLSGLQPGDQVVISGNFLIDSESKLNAVWNQISEPSE